MRGWLKKVLLGFVLIAIIAASVIWYLFNEKFTDTTKRKAAFTVDAQSFLKEFLQSDSLANIKYKEKIVTVNGTVSEIETMDSSINIKMIDTVTNAYVIFGFQNEQIIKVKNVKEGDKISVKGSCSGGSFSEIMEVEAVDLKRCVLN